ncbi:Rieske 2Fe-2S domain-containing protein [Segeticoccus rhizosphaerae]|jgi:nitrite reductase/ring-hydroxylating ferredoxin subunit/uncharacterized membrane protein|uniref:Rieske 2Fe-2S domain-containing protein n=1 Tax=Segeticoccus rhizosphaerae TaxID=1104777 RepID=UPI0010BFCDF2|nr:MULTISPECIES: Rieske 2Fe-2S domain-containing protein [Intrasporangiaceae]
MITTVGKSLEKVVRACEEATGLDAVTGPLGSVVSKVIGRGTVNDVLSGTPTGHPAHPAAVLVPVGAWLSAAALDVFGGVAGRPAAQRLVGLGCLGALPAAATGANDWMDTTGAERRVGLVHALCNLTALTLSAASWSARRRGQHRAGAALGLSGATVAMASGWLGGHLAYGLGVGVDTTAFQVVPTEWTDVCAETEVVQERGLLVHADGMPILLVRSEGRIAALADRCSHRGGPLHEGSVADGCVTCPWHGSRFLLRDGSVQHGPASRPMPTFEVRVQDGRVQVRAGDEDRSLRTNPVS